jgi:5-methylcytosine-specific restriction endonuclease McrA
MKENKINPICGCCGIKDERILLIHHRDCDRKNNNISNLVWLCWNCHFLVHNFDQKI